MKTALIVTAFLLLVCFWVFAYIQYIRNSVARRAFEEVDVTPSKNLNEEWYQLSWLKDEFGEPLSPNPVRVIGLAQKMAHDMDPFRGAAHMTSSFYSQIKHLLKMKQLPTAIAFYLESRSWATTALERAGHTEETVKPIDLEVLGAPDFLLAIKLPVLGKLFFEKSALVWLRKAEAAITPETSGMTKLLIYTKLSRLLEGGYVDGSIFESNTKKIRYSEIINSWDENQFARIADLLFTKPETLKDILAYDLED